MTADDATRAKGSELLRLHQDEKLLTLVNVWDVVSAKTVAAVEGTTALATASHSIAAAFGYPDGEKIPLDLMLEQVKRIVDATDLPVTADLEGGYGDAAETVRRAIGLGVVGANIEDQLKPLAEAAAQVEAIMKVAEQEGVDFVLNARTDAFSLNRKGDPAENLAVAIERGKAYLDAGAPVVFVPARPGEEQIVSSSRLGPRADHHRHPGMPPGTGRRRHGVARPPTARCAERRPHRPRRSWSRCASERRAGQPSPLLAAMEDACEADVDVSPPTLGSPPTLDELVAGATDRVEVRPADARSGARFERLHIDGEPRFLKVLSAEDDWIMRMTGNTTNWEFQVWRAGIYQQVPACLDHTILGMALEGTGPSARLSILMDDCADDLVPPRATRRCRAEHHAGFIDHMAAMHARFLGWNDDLGLPDPARRFIFFAPEQIAPELEADDVPGPIAVADQGLGRSARAGAAARRPGPVGPPRPDALVAALATTPSTFVGGDWKLGNLGRRPDGRTILVDQAYPGEAAAVLGPHLVPRAQPGPAAEARRPPSPATATRSSTTASTPPTGGSGSSASACSAWPPCSPGRRPSATRPSWTGGSGQPWTARVAVTARPTVAYAGHGRRRGPPTPRWPTARSRGTWSARLRRRRSAGRWPWTPAPAPAWPATRCASGRPRGRRRPGARHGGVRRRRPGRRSPRTSPRCRSATGAFDVGGRRVRGQPPRRPGRRACAELRRVTRPGGAVLASTFSADRSEAKQAVDVVAERTASSRPTGTSSCGSARRPRRRRRRGAGALRPAGSPLDGHRGAVDVGITAAEDVVRYRLGMPHLHAFAASLPGRRRAAFVADAVDAVAAPASGSRRWWSRSSRSPSCSNHGR